MSYSTVAFVREIVGKYGVTPEAFSDERIQDAINSADGLINGYAAGTYVTPFTIAGVVVLNDPLLNRLSADIAAYDIVLTFQGSRSIEQGDPVALRHSNALDTLKSVSTRKISWPFDSSVDDNLPSDIAVFSDYEGNLFGPEDFSIRPVGFDHGGVFRGRGPGPSGTW